MDNDNATVTDATVVETPVVAPVANPAVEVANAQKADFTKQLEQVKVDMSTLQKQFEDKKILGIRLEGAIQSLDLLLKSLQK